MISAITIAVSFAAVIIIFVVYDLLVRKRNENLIKKAAKSNAVVSNLFPDAIRDKMLGTEDNKSPSNKMKAFLHDGKVAQDRTEKVLADLYLDTTCLFADISSFTSWSSVRDPAQVFKLLETLYQAFDKVSLIPLYNARNSVCVLRVCMCVLLKSLTHLFCSSSQIAKKRKVFKVETVGDCCKYKGIDVCSVFFLPYMEETN